MTVCKDLGLAEAPNPNYRGGAVLRKAEDVVEFVRNLVRGSCGDTLNILFLQRLITDACWEIRYQEDVVPVIVTGATPAEVEGLEEFFNEKTIKVDGSSNPMKAFKAMKNKLKS
jgi:hypothetical protein